MGNVLQVLFNFEESSVSVIPYEAGPAAIVDLICTTFEILLN